MVKGYFQRECRKTTVDNFGEIPSGRKPEGQKCFKERTEDEEKY